jgi:hypothetical protein
MTNSDIPAVTPEMLLAVSRRKEKRVEVDGLASALVLKELSVKERLELDKVSRNEDGERPWLEFQAWLIVACLHDENGVRIFPMTEDSLGHVSSLCSDVFDKLSRAVLRVNGFIPEEGEGAGKNSETPPSDDSSSSLASNTESLRGRSESGLIAAI